MVNKAFERDGFICAPAHLNVIFISSTKEVTHFPPPFPPRGVASKPVIAAAADGGSEKKDVQTGESGGGGDPLQRKGLSDVEMALEAVEAEEANKRWDDAVKTAQRVYLSRIINS